MRDRTALERLAIHLDLSGRQYDWWSYRPTGIREANRACRLLSDIHSRLCTACALSRLHA